MTVQLISIGDAIINLERISVIDMDRDAGVIRLKFHGDSAQPVISFSRVGQDAITALFNLVPQQMRFRIAVEDQ
jgi:hypothetical protein